MTRTRKKSRTRRRAAAVSRATLVRLTKQVRAVTRRVRRLEGQRRRIGFRSRRDVLDTDARGEIVEQDEEPDDDDTP